jgi:hypothetical protein
VRSNLKRHTKRTQLKVYRFAELIFQTLLASANFSQAKDTLGHGCVKLCGLVQHCAKSGDSSLRRWAFREQVAASLFDFYIKSHDQDPHRSLRLILDILAVLVKSNPDPEIGNAIKEHILEFLVTTIVLKSARPLSKPSLQALNVLLNKHAVSLDDVAGKTRDIAPSTLDELGAYNLFMSRLISWMDLQHLCPVVGKVVVQVFCGLREMSPSTPTQEVGAATLRRWLQEAAALNPSILEDVKHYILKPLFKTSRAASVELLKLCNEAGAVEGLGSEFLDTNLLLQLAVLEVGKKADLVDEPGMCHTRLVGTGY